MGEKRNAHRIFMGKPKLKSLHGNVGWHRRKDSIMRNLEEIWCKGAYGLLKAI